MRTDENTERDERLCAVVFEYRPRARRAQFMCAACAMPAYLEGKMHHAVAVPIEDLAGKRCVICECPWREEERATK
jgi:hypothetical protein